MAIGNRRHRVVIEQEVRTADGGGGAARDWTTVAEVWAEIEPVDGREAVDGMQLEGRVTHRVRIRHRDGLSPAMRLRKGSRTFNIRRILNVDERDREIEMTVEEGVAT